MLQSSSLQASSQTTNQLEFANGGDGEQSLAPPLLLQYWQVVLRWKWVILGIIISSLVLGFVATLLATPKYTAKARIEISRSQKNVTKVEGLDSDDGGRDLEFYQTQYALLEARSLAERVVRQQRLASSTAFFKAHGIDGGAGSETSGGARPASLNDREENQKMAISLLLGSIKIVPVRGSALVDVAYTSASPQISAQIADAWAQQFIAASMDRRFASTADARSFLEGRLADLRTRLEQSERDLVAYASQKGIVSLGRSTGADGKTQSERTLIAANLEALNIALAAATADRIAAESRARSGANKELAVDPLIASGATSQLRQKRAEVAADYAKLMVQFEPGYPAARALAEQMRILDASIIREETRLTNRETGRSSNTRTTDYKAAVQRESELAFRVETLKRRLDLQQQDSIQYNIYQREADTNRQLYDALLQRYKEIGVAGVGTNNIVIVDTAKTPSGPSSPNLLLNLLIALFSGLGLAAVVTFVLDQIDEGLREPSQVYRLLQVPLLGSVPDVEGGDALAMLNDAKSSVSEAYLSIRSNLAFSTDHGVPRAFMVTSTRPAEGKSTSSLALASVLGRTGKRVLLLDADMRSPSMNEFLGCENKVGLSNFLAGDNDWQRLVQSTKVKGLSLMPAGPTPPSAAELLSSDRMLMLIRQLQESFDHVVVDAPPILGLADAPLLSRAVEGCVFVVEAEGVALRGIKASLGRLNAVHAHVFGVVLTKLQQRQSGYGYGYGHGYGYGKSISQDG
jgi:polysaccharide biosynthesis transport protein